MSIAYKNEYFWIRLQNFSWSSSFLKLQGNLSKIVAAAFFFQNMLCCSSAGTFPSYFKNSTKRSIFFQVFPVYFLKSHCVIQIPRVFLYTKYKWKMQIFDPTGQANVAGTVTCCAMISHSHVDKDLDKNEHLQLNLELNTTFTAACFSKITSIVSKTS